MFANVNLEPLLPNPSHRKASHWGNRIESTTSSIYKSKEKIACFLLEDLSKELEQSKSELCVNDILEEEVMNAFKDISPAEQLMLIDRLETEQASLIAFWILISQKIPYSGRI